MRGKSSCSAKQFYSHPQPDCSLTQARLSCHIALMKRRRFLKSVAFAGASGLILPRTKLFGADAPSNKLNVALIGTWGRGEAHFAGLATENVVALCDINEEH